MSAPQYDARCERCVPQETSIHCVLLATAYVPFQKFCGVWSPCKSLLTGTAFPELYSPYRKREYANLEPEVSCLGHNDHECKPCESAERRLLYGKG